MSYLSNDDDLFEEYVEEKSETTISSEQDHTETESQDPFDTIFSGLDSSFKDLILKSTFKVNLGDSFYKAAKEWEMNGYSEANIKAVLTQLAEITEGKFLYQHRLFSCAETIARKKTVLKFLSMILDDDSFETIVKSSDSTKSMTLTKSYFEMFFGSFYRINMYFYIKEVALHRTLSDMLGLPHDEDLYDLEKPTEVTMGTSTTINDLYTRYFNNEELSSKMDHYVEQYKNNQA